MAPPAPQPDLNRCWTQKDQPSSPNRLDLVVAVHPREAMQADGHRCRPVSAGTSDNLLTTRRPRLATGRDQPTDEPQVTAALRHQAST